MTSPIKPPGGPRPAHPVDPPANDPADARVSEASTFADAVVEAGETASGAAAGPEGPRGIGGADPSTIAEALRSGQIDARQALEQALASPAAQLLDEAGRTALREHLRATLVDDPTLAAMAGDLERSR